MRKFKSFCLFYPSIFQPNIQREKNIFVVQSKHLTNVSSRTFGISSVVTILYVSQKAFEIFILFLLMTTFWEKRVLILHIPVFVNDNHISRRWRHDDVRKTCLLVICIEGRRLPAFSLSRRQYRNHLSTIYMCIALRVATRANKSAATSSPTSLWMEYTLRPLTGTPMKRKVHDLDPWCH